jgi:rubrerythrin
VPEDNNLKLQDINPTPGMSVDEVVAAAVELEKRMITFYEEVAQKTTSLPPKVRDMFKQLMEQERQEMAELLTVAEQIKMA